MKKIIFPLLVILILISTGTTFYFHHQNLNLQANLIEAEQTNKKEVEALKQEVQSLKEKSSLVPKSQEVPVSSQVQENTPNKPIQENVPAKVPPESPTAITSTPETQTPVYQGPQLTISPETFDLGTISKKNGIVTAKYELKNSGTSELIISYAFTSCGCTVAPIKEEKTLTPGEIYLMEVTYDPNFYGPSYELGNVEKTVTIISNDSTKPFYKIKLITNVTP